MASGSGGALLASVAFPVPAGATTNSRIACADVYGPSGLVAAINAANAAGGGIISLAGGCTYTLTAPNNGVDGLPVVTSSVTINGNGSTIARSQAPGTAIFRIFDNDGNLTLNGLMVTGGDADFFDGGGISNQPDATLTLTTSQVVHNTADLGGGIISYTGTTVRMTSSHLSNNTARDGAGMSNQGSAVLTSSQVDNNTATSSNPRAGGIGGGGIANFGSLTLTSTQIKGNVATRDQPSTFPTQGGGVQNGGTLILAASQVTGNTVSSTNGDARGGGIFNDGTVNLTASGVTNNTASAPDGSAQGGGIFKDAGSVNLNGSPVLGNHPDNCAPLNSVTGCIG